MEKTKQKKELESILKNIQKAIEQYNKIADGENVELVKTKIDMSNIWICVYKDRLVDSFQIGLFRKVDYESNDNDEWGRNRGSVYFGVNSCYVGMNSYHEKDIASINWAKTEDCIVLNAKRYTVNCDMISAVSFENMRFMMYRNKAIGPYEIGKASSQEMLDVLNYAYSYYELDPNPPYKRKLEDEMSNNF